MEEILKNGVVKLVETMVFGNAGAVEYIQFHVLYLILI